MNKSQCICTWSGRFRMMQAGSTLPQHNENKVNNHWTGLKPAKSKGSCGSYGKYSRRPLMTCPWMRTALRHPWVSWLSDLVSWSWGTLYWLFCLAFFWVYNSVSSIYPTINMAVHSLRQGGPTLDYCGKQERSWLFAYSVITIDAGSWLYVPP